MAWESSGARSTCGTKRICANRQTATVLFSAFFGACERYRRAPGCIGDHDSVYAWISVSVLKGQRSASEVRQLAARVYNARSTRARYKHIRTCGWFNHCISKHRPRGVVDDRSTQALFTFAEDANIPLFSFADVDEGSVGDIGGDDDAEEATDTEIELAALLEDDSLDPLISPLSFQ